MAVEPLLRDSAPIAWPSSDTPFRPVWQTVGAGVLLATAAAGLVALPWLWQAAVPAEWVALAIPLLFIRHVRGWRGESLTLLAAVAAISMAFHWAPKVLAYSMQTNDEFGLLFAAPIILWDAIRLAAPFWVAARLTTDPRVAWLPAALVAVVLEACMPGVFPWKLGYSQMAWPPLVQSVDLFGPECATFVLFAHAGVLVAAALAIGQWCGRGATHGPATKGGTWLALAALAICAANLAYGLAAMAWWDRQAEAAPSLRVLLVQANPEEHDGVDALRRLTREATSAGAAFDLICWPECSGGSYETSLKSFADADKVMALSRDPRRGLRPLENPGCHLLFGGKIYEGHPQKPRALYQSAILLDSTETILGCYHKRHLMPFGEYVPGEEWYPEIKHYFPMQDVLTEGREACVLPAPAGARIGVMLCYEDMIPSAARSLVTGSANMLVSLINGAAFTEPLTLAQHRLLAQMRAIECRRFLIRTAATGETCVISPVGRVTARLPLHAEDTLAIDVPLLESRTLYGATGNLFPVCCAAGLAAAAWRARSRTG